MSSLFEDISTTTHRMATCSHNADVHPGLINAPKLWAPQGGVMKKKITKQLLRSVSCSKLGLMLTL